MAIRKHEALEDSRRSGALLGEVHSQEELETQRALDTSFWQTPQALHSIAARSRISLGPLRLRRAAKYFPITYTYGTRMRRLKYLPYSRIMISACITIRCSLAQKRPASAAPSQPDGNVERDRIARKASTAKTTTVTATEKRNNNNHNGSSTPRSGAGPGGRWRIGVGQMSPVGGAGPWT